MLIKFKLLIFIICVFKFAQDFEYIKKLKIYNISTAFFQTGSNLEKVAEDYLKTENSIFLEIFLTERLSNWICLKTNAKSDRELKNEYLIMPYASFKLSNFQ